MLPQEEKYFYTQNGDLLRNTLNATSQNQKENLERARSFRTSKNDYQDFENLSHNVQASYNETNEIQQENDHDNYLEDITQQVLINHPEIPNESDS
jgi:hypothetical protein